ncbi:hypothetical protein D9V73_00350 [Buchnera aphidicola (Melaphis rhois)]|uniref:Flagellar FliJ protein n=1 Tax=Buchnera aphidicola subsp. Melaphis rhois TaxID=118103 RepID=A0A4D6YBS5_BUCMH|nr:hypothetical protein D9V73_00350 [Buchnera aphidicola (Melaphis rhois)]
MILEKIVLNKNKIQDQINLLLKYQNEYLVKLNKKLLYGIVGFKLNNYDYFISSLIHGIEQQKKVIEKYDKQYQTYFVLWQKSQYRLRMWDMISSKLLHHRYQIIQLEEQMHIDECVQKSFFQKR